MCVHKKYLTFFINYKILFEFLKLGNQMLHLIICHHGI